MPVGVSNPRDLLVELLGRLLYVERRLADAVLRNLADALQDDELRASLRAHREETKTHADRIETAFHRLEVATTSNRDDAFESLVAQHERFAGSVKNDRLADVHHAAAALRAEHAEIAAYTAVLALAEATGYGDAVADLAASLRDEEAARATLEAALPRLASG
jgi:ferritin-like metal-binding protein YciE